MSKVLSTITDIRCSIKAAVIYCCYDLHLPFHPPGCGTVRREETPTVCCWLLQHLLTLSQNHEAQFTLQDTSLNGVWDGLTLDFSQFCKPQMNMKHLSRECTNREISSLLLTKQFGKWEEQGEERRFLSQI